MEEALTDPTTQEEPGTPPEVEISPHNLSRCAQILARILVSRAIAADEVEERMQPPAALQGIAKQEPEHP